MTPEQLLFSGAVSGVAGLLSAAATLLVARSRAREAARGAEAREGLLAEQHRRAETRVAELEQERRWMQDLSLGAPRTPAPSGRPRRRDLTSLANLVGGLANVEETCVCDTDGLVHSEARATRATELAVFGAQALALEKKLVSELGGLVEVRVVLADAAHVTARPLRGWAEGFAIVASAISRAPNPAALNAVVSAVALASQGRVALPRPRTGSPPRSQGGGPRALLDELARLSSSDVDFADFTGHGGLGATWTNGRAELTPTPEAIREIERFAARARHALRGPETLRVDLVFGGRSSLTWAASPDGTARVVLGSRGREIDDAALSRLFGRAARIAPASGDSVGAGAEAA
jgi:hypothetical protein